MNASQILQSLMRQAGGSGGTHQVRTALESLLGQSGGASSGAGHKRAEHNGTSAFDIKSLLGGGALGMLVGSKRGRKLGGSALKYGAIAGVGVLAWKAWQSTRQGSQGGDVSGEGERVEVLEGEYQERRSLELLQAMIMAARADGHIDAEERAMIAGQIDELGADDELHAWVERTLNAPLDARALAAEADSPQAAREMYLISVAVSDEQNAMERAWLDELAGALELSPALAGELEKQAREASQD